MAREPLSRELIVATAREIVVADGVDALSLRTLAARLHVTAPALYAYVDDKRDLLLAVAAQEFDRLAERFAACADTDPLDRVRSNALAYVEGARQHPALFQVMFLFRPDIVPQPEVDELPAATRAVSLAMEAVQEAMDAGQLRAGDALTVSLTLWAGAFGAAQFVLTDFGFDDDYVRLITESVIDTLIAGLRP